MDNRFRVGKEERGVAWRELFVVLLLAIKESVLLMLCGLGPSSK